jgi:hypothetical protein
MAHNYIAYDILNNSIFPFIHRRRKVTFERRLNENRRRKPIALRIVGDVR